MAERRMFAKTIIDSDAFLDMPLSTQALYFHLSMRADDEGFINNPNKIQRMIGASNDDMKMLLAKNFIIHFDSGVIVIKHWKIHNYIRADRLVETTYKDERNMLEVKENGAYTISKDLKEIAELDELSSQDKRKLAYQNSTLPYSFDYKIKRAFGNKICPVCGKIMNPAYKKSLPTIQHNIPLSKGGEHELNNISIICESCNTSIRDDETDSLNNEEVIRVWDNIVAAEKQNINWFWDVKLLETVGCQTNDGQMTDKCQNSIGKDSIDKDSIGEVSTDDKSSEPPVITLLLKDKTEYGITQKDIEHYKELYPAVDIMQELRNMKGWCESHPTKRKTRAGVKRFITGWLSKEKGSRNNKQPDDIKAKYDKWSET